MSHKRSRSQNKLAPAEPTSKFSIRSKNFVINCGNLQESSQKLVQMKIKAGASYNRQVPPRLEEAKTPSSKLLINHPYPTIEKERAFSMQKEKVEQLRQRIKAESREAIKARSIQTRERKRQVQRMQRDIEQERIRQAALRQKNNKRQKTATSLIFEDHKESIKMMRRSRLQRTRSEHSLADESLRETERNFKFTSEKERLQKERKKYEYEYRKAFVKNQPQPKQSCPDPVFYQTLSQKSKKLNQLYASIPQKTNIDSKKRSTTGNRPKQHDLGKELRITSIIPLSYAPMSLLNLKKGSKAMNPEKVEKTHKKKQRELHNKQVACDQVQPLSLAAEQNETPQAERLSADLQTHQILNSSPPPPLPPPITSSLPSQAPAPVNPASE